MSPSLKTLEKMASVHMRAALLVIMIEQEKFCVVSRTELCEAKSWTRQTLSDAWDATNWDAASGGSRIEIDNESRS